MEKKLYKSVSNRMICGVCGGLGEYLNIDPNIIRILWAIFACSGAGIIVYLLAAIILPEQKY